YTYEAGVVLSLGSAESRLTFPALIDISSLQTGKISVAIQPPLAGLIPQEWIDRIKLKTGLVANPAVQKKILDYLDSMAKEAHRQIYPGPSQIDPPERLLFSA